MAAVHDGGLAIMLDHHDGASERREGPLERRRRAVRTRLARRPVALPGARCNVVGTGETQGWLLAASQPLTAQRRADNPGGPAAVRELLQVREPS